MYKDIRIRVPVRDTQPRSIWSNGTWTLCAVTHSVKKWGPVKLWDTAVDDLLLNKTESIT